MIDATTIPKNTETTTPTIPTGKKMNNAGMVHITKKTSQGKKKHNNAIFPPRFIYTPPAFDKSELHFGNLGDHCEYHITASVP